MHGPKNLTTNLPLNIAVIGTGISGMSAAWLLSKGHNVTVYEKASRIGGHSNTVDVHRSERTLPVDTGFIVYNEPCYPNLTALFAHLDVPTSMSDMSFSVSMDEGQFEYSGTGLNGLFAQRRNLFNPRFWSMLRDLLRFYRETPSHAGKLGLSSLGEYLERENYGRAFQDDHLLPMAAAIWSAPPERLREYPAEAFIRFCDNHGLLQLSDRPRWRTVEGGSRAYVERLTADYKDRVKTGCGVRSVKYDGSGVMLVDAQGQQTRFDHVVMACHADEALALIENPSAGERQLLGAFQYSRNLAVLHSDAQLMPRRRSVWASWNYLSRRDKQAGSTLCVTYWMNRLQNLPQEMPLFLTLNPMQEPEAASIVHSEIYDHPIFNAAALAAQRRLWSLQGHRKLWFCGAYFGAGFHEDGLQSGLAVAEELGGIRRPWTVLNESGRIFLKPGTSEVEAA